ncbi:MAG: hypothetical protein ACFFCV_11645 [Promethearchaeota archaeon]
MKEESTSQINDYNNSKLNLIRLDLKGYIYEQDKIRRNYGNKLIYTKLLKYSKKIIEDYVIKNSLITNSDTKKRNENQLIFEKDGTLRKAEYLIKGDGNFDKILNSRKKYGYEAIVYKLKSKLTPWKNKVYFGFSKHNVRKRMYKHIMATIGPHGYCPECEYVNYVKLHEAILNALNFEKINIRFEYRWLKSKMGTLEYKERMDFLLRILKRYFEIETVELHRKKETAKRNEKWHTKNYVNDDGTVGTVENGLNEICGGSDGQYIQLPLIDIAAMLSIGIKPKRIHRLIVKLYSIDVAYETVSERIRDIWEGYSDALELFLKPVVEALIMDDSDFQFNEICTAINRDRSNARMYLKYWYNGRTFLILKTLKKKGVLDWSNLPFYNEEERPELRGISLKTWKKWSIEGVTCKKIGEKLGLNEETIRQTYKDIPELGSPQKCRDTLRKKIIRKLLAENWDPKKIMEDKFKMTPRDNYCIKIFYERLFHGLKFEEIVVKGKKYQL